MTKYVIKDSADGASYDFHNRPEETGKPSVLVGSFSRHAYSFIADESELADFHLNDDLDGETE